MNDRLCKLCYKTEEQHSRDNYCLGDSEKWGEWYVIMPKQKYVPFDNLDYIEWLAKKKHLV